MTRPARPLALAACMAVAACSGNAGAMPQQRGAGSPAARTATISHIVIIVQENRSFDNLFATFPGADGATSGYFLKTVGSQRVPTLTKLVPQPLDFGKDINHASQAYNYACDGQDTYPKTSCAMDGFNLEGIDGNNPAGKYPYQYIKPSDIKPYWLLAKRYGLGDHLFQTQGSGSFTAHQDLIAGGTTIDDAACGTSQTACALIDYPGPKNSSTGVAPRRPAPRRPSSPSKAPISRARVRFHVSHIRRRRCAICSTAPA